MTMNTDALPESAPDGFSIADHILDIRLTDVGADGGLFGHRF